MTSVLRGTIEFLQDFGLFDVVLPFLLIFAIIFAILEKTLILGKESSGEPKKNINSIVALVVALLFVSANKAVNIITSALPNIALMIVIAMSFLLMLGIFWKTEEFDFKDNESKWYVFFSFVMFVALALIFMGAYMVSPGVSLLSKVFNSISGGPMQEILTIFAIVGAIIGLIIFVTKKPKKGDDD